MRPDPNLTQPLGEQRKIQIGEASWAGDPDDVELAGGDRSIRMYYRNSRGGMRRNSPEVSLRDLTEMVTLAANRGQFTAAQRNEMTAALSSRAQPSI